MHYWRKWCKSISVGYFDQYTKISNSSDYILYYIIFFIHFIISYDNFQEMVLVGHGLLF